MWEITSHNRRRAPRHKVRIPSSISLVEKDKDVGTQNRPPAAIGHTRDISTEGLALLVPAIRIADKEITASNQTLRVALALPIGEVELDATFMRHERCHEAEAGMPYLVGLQIADMSAVARAFYYEYIRTLH